MSDLLSPTETPPESPDCAGRDPFSSVTDGDLLSAWTVDHSTEAFAELVRRYGAMVMSVARRRCRSAADADDAFQSTFLLLASNAKKIKQPERLPGWLHRVAQRSAVATITRAGHPTEPIVDAPSTPEDPLDRLSMRHDAIVLDEELDRLPERYRWALVLHIQQGFTLAQLAEKLGTSIGVVRGRLQRGKKLLADRLRLRGVVPALAYASVGAWTISAASISEASERLIGSISAGDVPSPPVTIDPSHLQRGTPLMPSAYTAGAAVAATALCSVIAIAQFTSAPQQQGSRNPITVQSAGASVQPGASASKSDPSSIQLGSPNRLAQFRGDVDAAVGTGGGLLAGGVGDMGALAEEIKFNVGPQPPKTRTGLEAVAALDAIGDVSFSQPIKDLPAAIKERLGTNIYIEPDALSIAGVQGEAEVTFEETQLPLRTALHRILSPLGLKALATDDGIVVQPDYSVLTARGEKTDRWINVDNAAEKAIRESLNKRINFEFIDTPLEEAVQTLGKLAGVAISIDLTALEEIGVTQDSPVTGTLNNVKLSTAFEFLLRAHDLTYSMQTEILTITTPEEAESDLLIRMYWLEGTIAEEGDFDSLTQLIQSTVTPDTWEALGGPSTINPLVSRGRRPCMTVATTYDVHQRIASVLASLRETPETISPPAPNPPVRTQPRVKRRVSSDDNPFGNGGATDDADPFGN